jgi:hypothetical protein
VLVQPGAAFRADSLSPYDRTAACGAHPLAIGNPVDHHFVAALLSAAPGRSGIDVFRSGKQNAPKRAISLTSPGNPDQLNKRTRKQGKRLSLAEIFHPNEIGNRFLLRDAGAGKFQGLTTSVSHPS